MDSLNTFAVSYRITFALVSERNGQTFFQEVSHDEFVKRYNRVFDTNTSTLVEVVHDAYARGYLCRQETTYMPVEREKTIPSNIELHRDEWDAMDHERRKEDF